MNRNQFEIMTSIKDATISNPLPQSPFASPAVTKDVRFRAARKLVQRGRVQDGAVEIFRVLVHRAEEEFESKIGSCSHSKGCPRLNIAAAYYEYGHSLFLNTCRENDRRKGENVANSSPGYADAIEEALEYMAESVKILFRYYTDCNDAINVENSATNVKSDASTNSKTNLYRDWVQNQIPRVLIGIGNVMSFRGAHSQAVESYLNAIPYREETLEYFKQLEVPGRCTVTNQLEVLRCHRLVVEVHVLIAEELLLCPKGQDVKSQSHHEVNAIMHDGLDETVASIVIVKSAERLLLAKNYYEQGKDQLQELGKINSTRLSNSDWVSSIPMTTRD